MVVRYLVAEVVVDSLELVVVIARGGEALVDF